MKPAGGIRTSKDAIKYLVMVNEVAGPDWLDPDWFPLGASTLLNDLLMQRTKMATGRYSGPDTSPWTDQSMTSNSTMRPRPSPARWWTSSPLGLSVNGEFTDGGGKSFKTITPSTEEVPLGGRRGRREGRRPRCEGRPSRLLAGVVEDERRRARQVPLPDRADHPGAGREICESIDNGKPIKELRDVDPERRSVVLLLRRLGARRRATPSCSSRPRPHRSPHCCSLRSANRPTCPRAWSTSSPARAPQGTRSSRTTTWTRSRSPAPPTWAGRSPRRSPGRGRR